MPDIEFLEHPTEEQVAEVERGLDEHNAGVASARFRYQGARGLRRFGPGSWPAWTPLRTGASST